MTDVAAEIWWDRHMIDLDELQSELTDSLKPQGELRPLCLKAAKAIADLRSQLIKMTNAFERYGHHDSDCIHEPWHGKGAIRCSCGLYEATDLSDD